jgi:hypothetical protein
MSEKKDEVSPAPVPTTATATTSSTATTNNVSVTGNVSSHGNGSTITNTNMAQSAGVGVSSTSASMDETNLTLASSSNVNANTNANTTSIVSPQLSSATPVLSNLANQGGMKRPAHVAFPSSSNTSASTATANNADNDNSNNKNKKMAIDVNENRASEAVSPATVTATATVTASTKAYTSPPLSSVGNPLQQQQQQLPPGRPLQAPPPSLKVPLASLTSTVTNASMSATTRSVPVPVSVPRPLPVSVPTTSIPQSSSVSKSFINSTTKPATIPSSARIKQTSKGNFKTASSKTQHQQQTQVRVQAQPQSQVQVQVQVHPQTQTQPQAQAQKPPIKLAPLNRKNKNLTEKKIRRLEKNRLSARNCRRKKKEVTQNLQHEINILEGQNLRLRLQLQIGEEAEQVTKEEQDRVTEGLDSLLKSGASDSEIYLNIEDFKEKYADYGRDRRSAIDFHLRNVERLLMPTTTTTTVMRALDGGMNLASPTASTSANATTSTGIGKNTSTSINGGTITSANATTGTSASTIINATNNHSSNENEKSNSTLKSNVNIKIKEEEEQTKKPSLPTASATNTNTSAVASQNATPVAPKSLFQYLVKYLQVTPSQAAALKDSRHVAKELDSALVKSLAMLQELRERLTQCTDDLDAEFTKIRSILTPRQAAKFLVWVSNNGACMHMLNELWRRQYPEPKVIEDGDSNEEAKDVESESSGVGVNRINDSSVSSSSGS